MHLAAAVVAAGTLLLSGCSGRSPEEEVAAARASLAQHDENSAIIRLKNALQRKPSDPEARFLLGQALLRSNDPGGAAIELKKALDYGYDKDQALPELATALVESGQFKRLVDDYGNAVVGSDGGSAELKAALATAYYALGDQARWSPLLEAAMKAAPIPRRALLLKAQTLANAGQPDAALENLDILLKAQPQDQVAWYFKGQLLDVRLGKTDEAIQAYQKVLQLQPRHAAAHGSLIMAYLRAGKRDAAQKQLVAMREQLPTHPSTRYHSAVLALENGNLAEARTAVNEVLKVAPDSVQALELSGIIELRDGAMLRAETALTKALQLDSSLSSARLQLAEVYQRSGRAQKALDVLDPLLSSGKGSADAYSLAGEAQLVQGNLKQAEQSFERAAKLAPDDTRSRTALALMPMSRGDATSTLTELRSISRSSSDTRADFALVAVSMRLGRYDDALAAIDALAGKAKGNPMVSLLRGRVQLLRKDRAAAVAAFTQALKDDPGYVEAARELAALDLQAGDAAAARRRYEGVLAKDPGNLQALTAIAGLAESTGAKKEDVIALLSRAVEANPNEPAPRVDLVNFLLAQGDTETALTTAQSAVAAMPNRPEPLDALGLAQQANSEYNQAIASFRKAAQMMPQSAQPLTRIAAVHIAQGNRAEALISLREAVALQPTSLPTHLQLFRTALDAGRVDEARAVARNMQKQFPNSSQGWLSQGVVEMHTKDWAQAITAFRAAFSLVPSTEAVLRLHGALTNAGRSAEANKVAADWFASHPRDAGAHTYFGDMALAKGDYATAERHFAAVVSEQPKNVMAWNNLAWARAKTGNPSASDTARRAVSLAPESAVLLDTLAVALESEKKDAEGEEVRRKAVALAPSNGELRLGLAKAYLRHGKQAEAKNELQKVLRGNVAAETRKEAEGLLQRM